MYLGWYSDNIIKPLFDYNVCVKLEYQQSYRINYLRINTILIPMIGSAIFLKLTSKYNRRYNKRNRARKCRKQMKQIFQANHTFHKINIYNYFLNFELSTPYWQHIDGVKTSQFLGLIFWLYIFLDFIYFSYLIH